MELDKFLIGILVFTAIIVGGTLIIGDINTNYDFAGTNISTDEFGDVYDTTNEIYNLSQDMKDGVFGDDIEEDDTADSMFKGGYKTIRFIRESFSLVGDIINAVSMELGSPSFFVTLALAGLTIAIVFGIIMIIFRIGRG